MSTKCSISTTNKIPKISLTRLQRSRLPRIVCGGLPTGVQGPRISSINRQQLCLQNLSCSCCYVQRSVSFFLLSPQHKKETKLYLWATQNLLSVSLFCLNLPDGRSWPVPPKTRVLGKSLGFQSEHWNAVAERRR